MNNRRELEGSKIGTNKTLDKIHQKCGQTINYILSRPPSKPSNSMDYLLYLDIFLEREPFDFSFLIKIMHYNESLSRTQVNNEI